MSLTDNAIVRIRELIQTGALPPGAKLPPEQQLAAELGLSRNLMREAVKALVVARVLEIRRGDGTYVTSLQPSLLLEGLAVAVELLHGETLLELTETRRLFEPVATGLAARRMTPEALAVVADELDAMRAARDDVELLVHHDAAFHRAVLAATGNETLISLLDGISGRTLRGRIWRALVDEHASERTLAEHEAIYHALADGDASLAQATALVHVSSTEHWLRRHLEIQRDLDAAPSEESHADEADPLSDPTPADDRAGGTR
ncbi:FadR/GntR family transcriptional regulator [Streptomyces profundus]|uniref:FadR/GntR family transcriptional regulator n=1 Tax=Streptomyces profundus TaxID=2867410 RepID=UPI001D16902D|nr:FadR/GntR family transcriptional regulator [Streptomyces sp. MA3_2.13]UED87156.1 FadR family transcriptional regulator [Streptomyces sp. MA3_2.13]